MYACNHLLSLYVCMQSPPIAFARFGDQLRAIEGVEILHLKLRQAEQAEAFHYTHEKGLGEGRENSRSSSRSASSRIQHSYIQERLEELEIEMAAGKEALPGYIQKLTVGYDFRCYAFEVSCAWFVAHIGYGVPCLPSADAQSHRRPRHPFHPSASHFRCSNASASSPSSAFPSSSLPRALSLRRPSR